MKSFPQCVNCDEYTGGNKFCADGCKSEYYSMNVHMSQQAYNTLALLDERRGWVSMEYTATIISMVNRFAPLIHVRNVNKRYCEVHILPNGERWLQYHAAGSESAA